MSLLDKVKDAQVKIKPRGKAGKYSDDEMKSVALAWLRGEVGTTALNHAMGQGGVSSLSLVAKGCRLMFRDGELIYSPPEMP